MFLINIASVLIGIVILSAVQMLVMDSYVKRESEQSISKNADSIVSLIKNNPGISQEVLSVFLNGFSKSGNIHVFVVDSQGNVLVSTDESGFVSGNSNEIGKEYQGAVLSGKRNTATGTFGGIFNETMFTLQVPVISEASGTVIGAVYVSTPMPERRRMTEDFFKMTFICALIVLAVAFALSYMFSRRLVSPIKKIGTSVRNFAKGNFDSRVDLSADEETVEEIAKLAKSFNNMARQIEHSEEVRSSFISDVSHELRTPMTTIGGFIEAILDDTVPPERQKEYLTVVLSEVKRLTRLVNTFLDITRMKSDKMVINRTDFDINESIRLVVIGLEHSIEEKRIDVKLEFPDDKCFVRADKDAIMQVLTNLMDNAVKFTNNGGEIKIKVEPHHGEVSVSIRNTGCGIPKEQQGIIFERLYKVDRSRSINPEGTGIGLYLVKNIIDAHGKSIYVKSEPNEFAEFVFTLDKGHK